jgi:hypothetical protein
MPSPNPPVNPNPNDPSPVPHPEPPQPAISCYGAFPSAAPKYGPWREDM